MGNPPANGLVFVFSPTFFFAPWRTSRHVWWSSNYWVIRYAAPHNPFSLVNVKGQKKSNQKKASKKNGSISWA